ncbi:unnamed protein product [Heterobilharzia americana]|nr:unnamed protein product [Heterobilharzia americana]CAH8583846.1 unnamed protein product [Heterobilharzia americana]
MYQSSSHNSHNCQQYSMGNCSLCKHEEYGNDCLRNENDSQAGATFQNIYNMSNSLSYPLLSGEYHTSITNNVNPHNVISIDRTQSENTTGYDATVLMNDIREYGWPFFEKSTSAFSLCSHAKSNFSSSYRDCRLRYIKQTRKLQKYLRVTPEGHILVNNPKIEHQLYQNTQQPQQQLSGNHSYNHSKINTFECKSNLNKLTTNEHELCNNPFGSLISTPKIKRIYAAFWNLEPRESITVRKLQVSSTTPLITTTSTMTTTSESANQSETSITETTSDYYINGCNHFKNNEQDDDLKSTLHNIISVDTQLEPLMENSVNDSSGMSDPVLELN